MFTDTFEMNIKIRYVDTERANIGFIGNGIFYYYFYY